MAIVKIMYWKEIPIHIQAEDEFGRVSKPLDDRFQEGIDAISMFDGSEGNDDYLDGWEWSQLAEIKGSAEEAANTIAERYNQGFPQNFVSMIRDLEKSGKRIPHPGAIDHWIEK